MYAMHIAIVRAILRQLSKHIIMNDIQLRRYSVQVFRLRVFHCIRNLRGIHAEGQLAKCHCSGVLKPCSPRACRRYIPDRGSAGSWKPTSFFLQNPDSEVPLPRGPTTISIEFAFACVESGVRENPRDDKLWISGPGCVLTPPQHPGLSAVSH